MKSAPGKPQKLATKGIMYLEKLTHASSLLMLIADPGKDLGSLRSPCSLAARCATAGRYKMRQAVAHLAARS